MDKEKDILIRIRWFINFAYAGNDTLFAEAMGYSRQNATDYIRGKRGINKQFKTKFEGVGGSPLWLEYLVGDMLADNKTGEIYKELYEFVLQRVLSDKTRDDICKNIYNKKNISMIAETQSQYSAI